MKKLELNSILVYKIGVPPIGGTDNDIIEEIPEVSLIFEYSNPQSSLEIERITIDLRDLSPKTSEIFNKFVQSAIDDTLFLLEQEFAQQ